MNMHILVHINKAKETHILHRARNHHSDKTHVFPSIVKNHPLSKSHVYINMMTNHPLRKIHILISTHHHNITNEESLHPFGMKNLLT